MPPKGEKNEITCLAISKSSQKFAKVIALLDGKIANETTNFIGLTVNDLEKSQTNNKTFLIQPVFSTA